MTEHPVHLRPKLASAAEEHGAFDLGRDLSDKAFYSACYAPVVSMYFDQFGKVRACCQNTAGLLGDIGTQSIHEIWHSAEAQRLRSHLARRDMSNGCGFCQWQVDEGGTSPFAREFDRHAVDEVLPRWPTQMEFSMTNSCNLQCVMCNGDWSSSIRAHREHRPALPQVYGDSFFQELAEFLPHLKYANFLGGEPFLGAEPMRVLQMLLDVPPRAQISVTTNATQWSDRIERMCNELPISFVVSIDGITKETYESIRVGANFDVVMRNIERFGALTDGSSRHLTFAHCLMRPNWHEFIDLLLFAEDHGIESVGVNSVLFPRHLSLYQMAELELREVVATLERQDAERGGRLVRMRGVWEEQITALRNRLRILQTAAGAALDPWADARSLDPWEDEFARALRKADSGEAEELRGWSGGTVFTVRCDIGWRLIDGQKVDRPIIEVDDAFLGLSRLRREQVIGQPMSFVLDALQLTFGAVMEAGPLPGARPNRLRALFEAADGETTEVREILLEDDDEVLVLLSHRTTTL